GVLGGKDGEHAGERIAGAVHGDLPFLHGFEQGGLGLGGGAVDLVAEDELGEDGAGPELEGLLVRVEDVGADDVGGHQVRGELDAFEGAVEEAGQDADEEGLGGAGDALDKDVAAGKQADQKAVDDLVLADDHLGDLAAGGLVKVTG